MASTDEAEKLSSFHLRRQPFAASSVPPSCSLCPGSSSHRPTPLHMLKRHRMRSTGLSDFDLEDGRKPDLLEPQVPVQAADAQHSGFVKRLGFYIGAMADSAHLFGTDNARMRRHGPRVRAC